MLFSPPFFFLLSKRRRIRKWDESRTLLGLFPFSFVSSHPIVPYCVNCGLNVGILFPTWGKFSFRKGTSFSRAFQICSLEIVIKYGLTSEGERVLQEGFFLCLLILRVRKDKKKYTSVSEDSFRFWISYAFGCFFFILFFLMLRNSSPSG